MRLIVATNRDLRREVEAGRFREDLFYRLEVYPITVPPLRDRSDDIEVLVRHFAAELSRSGIGSRSTKSRRRCCVSSRPTDWPGNIRELQNVVERAVLNAIDGVLRLVRPLDARPRARRPAPSRPSGPGFRTLEELQRDHIVAVIDGLQRPDCGFGWRRRDPRCPPQHAAITAEEARDRRTKIELVTTSRHDISCPRRSIHSHEALLRFANGRESETAGRDMKGLVGEGFNPSRTALGFSMESRRARF